METNLEYRQNSKRLAKNTIVLYLRSIVTMAVGIYASRVVLEVLGVEDYGIYSLIGGVVALFQMVSATFVSSTQRCLSFEMGKRENGRVRQTFSAAMKIHVYLALVMLVLFETVGLWFVKNKLAIPEGREFATVCVFHLTVASFLVNIISLPYNALIVAKEKMTVFAYVSIYEAFAKLGVLYLLSIGSFDKLILYAIYIFLISITVRLFWSVYCRRKVPEAKIEKVTDKGIYKEMLNLSAWVFFGSSAAILTQSGINIVINIFFGVVINAAKGIASTVEHAVSMLVNNFTMSLKPQITKAYSSGDVAYMWSLVDKGTRLSFFLMTIMIVPILTVTDSILSVWLTTIPPQTVIFIRVILIYSMFVPFKTILDTVLLSEGNVRNWQICSCIIDLSNLPLCYLFFVWGFDAYVSYIIMSVVNGASLMNRLHFCRKKVGIKVGRYLVNVFLLSWGVMLLALALSLFSTMLSLVNPWSVILIEGGLSLLITGAVIFLAGLKKSERALVVPTIKKKLLRQ